MTQEGRHIKVGDLDVEHMRQILRMILRNRRLRRLIDSHVKSGIAPSREQVAALLRAKVVLINEEAAQQALYDGCEDANGGPL